MSTAKAELHRLVDELPEGEVSVARKFLELLKKSGTDPVLRSLATAPVDDEPESRQEVEAVERARDQESVSTDDLLETLDREP